MFSKLSKLIKRAFNFTVEANGEYYYSGYGAMVPAYLPDGVPVRKPADES